MKPPIYFDNAASTPTRAEVLEVMLPFLSGTRYGNASSAHSFGRDARAGVEEARRQVGTAIGVKATQVVFTSGGTEADNLAIIGATLAAKNAGKVPRVAVSAVEHPAVARATDLIVQMGGEVVTLDVNAQGHVQTDQLDEELKRGLTLVSVMWVNNEVGFIQDIADLAERTRAGGALFHTDAVQAVGKTPCSIEDLPVDLLSLSGHKIGGPLGSGALIVRDRKAVGAMVHGGGQQFGLRPGTENVPGSVGLGRAVELAVAETETFDHTIRPLRDCFEQQLIERVPDAAVTAQSARRVPHISNVTIPGIDSQAMQMHLDLAGIACSGGSACKSGTAEPSPTLLALGVPNDLATRALRISFYKQNTRDEVEAFLDVLPAMVQKVRALSASLGR